MPLPWCTNPKASCAPWGWGLTPHGVLPPPVLWRTVPLWQTSVELPAGRLQTPYVDSTVFVLSHFIPMCWVKSKWWEELGGCHACCAIPPHPGIRVPFSSSRKFSGWQTLVEFLQHPRQSDWVEQPDARSSIGVSSPGSPVSPCTGLGVHMDWFPSGNPICVFFHGKFSPR